MYFLPGIGKQVAKPGEIIVKFLEIVTDPRIDRGKMRGIIPLPLTALGIGDQVLAGAVYTAHILKIADFFSSAGVTSQPQQP